MDITIFNYQGIKIRTIMGEDGEPWWVAKDACEVLGLQTEATRRLDLDEKGLHQIQTLRGEQAMIVVNEPGLYNLINGSKKKEAKRFSRWIRHEVLPSIRKTGSYGKPPAEHMLIPRTYAEALQLAADQASLIEEQRPKIEFVGRYVDSHGLKTLTEASKTLDFKRKDLIEILERDGYLFRRQGRLEPYATAVSRGLFALKTGEANNRVYCQVYVTARGIQHIAETYRSELAA